MFSQEEDTGAYSCEALNNRGSTFAIPDTILMVNKTGSVCPEGSFNELATTPEECIPCFCFGISTTCKSANLFIYQVRFCAYVGNIVLKPLLGTSPKESQGRVREFFFRIILNMTFLSHLRTVTPKNNYCTLISHGPQHVYHRAFTGNICLIPVYSFLFLRHSG